MPQLVVTGAMMQCSFGAAPSTLNAIPHQAMGGGPPAANIMDFAPITNIPPFGMCTSMANPQVAAATSAAMGVLTPQPCIPVPTGPWVPGSPTVMLGNQPALNSTSKCMCSWAGVIQITNPGQVKIDVP